MSAVRGRAPPDGVERILSDLLGGLRRPEEPVEDAEYRPAVPVVQLAESDGVAPGDPGHKRSIVTSLVTGYDIRVGDG